MRISQSLKSRNKAESVHGWKRRDAENVKNAISTFLSPDTWKQGDFCSSLSGRIFQTQSHVIVID